MKKTLIICSIVLVAMSVCQNTMAQEKPTYWSSGGEFIFSFANVKKNNVELNNVVRFTLFLHIQQYINKDFSEKAGFYSGFSLKNIGFIYDEANGIRKKMRTYNFGIPLAFKYGDLKHDFFFYGGGQYDLVVNYKEKTFENNNKSKFNSWFSDRTPRFVPSLFAGVQFPYGSNLRFTYYPQNFLNPDFIETDGNGVNVKPYEGMDARVFSISLSFMIYHRDGMKFKEMYKYD